MPTDATIFRPKIRLPWARIQEVRTDEKGIAIRTPFTVHTYAWKDVAEAYTQKYYPGDRFSGGNGRLFLRLRMRDEKKFWVLLKHSMKSLREPPAPSLQKHLERHITVGNRRPNFHSSSVEFCVVMGVIMGIFAILIPENAAIFLFYLGIAILMSVVMFLLTLWNYRHDPWDR